MTAIHDDAPSRRGAVDDAIRRMRAAAAADGRADGPGAAGTADPAVLRTVLATLPHDDQRLLWDRHVVGREVAAIATELGMHARGVLRRLRQAEERLAAAFAAAHARACPPACLPTRQSLHSYLRHRLSPPRRTVLEAHLFGCQGCMRAFIDVREAAWAVRDAGPLLLAGTVTGAVAGGVSAPVVVGALGAGTSAAGALATAGPVGAALLVAVEWVRGLALRLGQLGKGGLITAGTVAGVAVTAVAVALGGSGGAAGPAAAPAAPAPTSSAAAPAPVGTPAPEVPPEPQPSAEDPTASPTAPETSPPATTAPDATAPDAPSTGSTTSPSTPTAEGSGDAGPSPSTPEPSRPSSGPAPSATPEPSSTPTVPSPSPSPTRSPSPTPRPTITEQPEPELVLTTLTRTVDAGRHRTRSYRVIAPGSATVVDVRAHSSKVRISSGVEGWRVDVPPRWFLGSRSATVEIDVEVPADVEPDVTLQRIDD
ncbi:zf-HC2 domain-containing protein [Isoptericola sp. 4D.3]|uniref:Zf-HC2 domain-containing protein n=1 Tax=Isoptericola peretonis TaxID=2918523 RepID=A0ABT0J395_9MICO|nr:zf-HC2 domain-containing protein [Isoptericola sp. 4D.3]